MHSNETVDLLLAHSSVRQFTPRLVSEETVDTILRCAQRAPTSSYLQAYSIIRVVDPEKRKALMEFSGGQKWLVTAPLVLLFCGDLYRVEQLLQPEDSHVLHNAELFTVAVADASLVAQRAFIAAQALGLGGVIVGGVRNETAGMAELFGLPKLVYPLFALCLGYPETVPAQRPRLAQRFVCGIDGYPPLPTQEELAAYDDEVCRYFLEHTTDPNRFGWVARGQHAISAKPRYAVGDYLQAAGFLTEREPSV